MVGGEPEVLTTVDREQGETDHEWPEILPSGEAVLFTIVKGRGAEHMDIAVLDLVTGEQKRLIAGGGNPRYAPTGHLVYAADGTLRAVGFDADRLTVTGNPVPILENVETKGSGAANFSLSDDGALVFVSGTSAAGAKTLVWVDREGREEQLALPPGDYTRARVSPGRTRLAVQVLGPEGPDVWTADVARGGLSILTPDPAADRRPLWTPDGDRVVFLSDREGSEGLFWKAADSRGAVEPLLTVEDAQELDPSSWSPDGSELIFDYLAPNTARDIGVLSMEGERLWQPLLNSAANEWSPALSRDGRWIAYASDETGQNEVYVERFPDLGNREQISTGGGLDPVWSADGSELFYRSGSRMMVVPIDTEPTLTPGAATVVFEGPYYPLSVVR